MSASAITDAFITQLSATSAFGDSVSDLYDVLEYSAACAVVVNWTNLSPGIQVAFGPEGPLTNNWTFTIEGFIKDQSYPSEQAPKVSGIVDTIYNCVMNDRTIQGTVERVIEVRASRAIPPDGFVEAHGNLWHRSVVEVDVEEYN